MKSFSGTQEIFWANHLLPSNPYHTPLTLNRRIILIDIYPLMAKAKVLNPSHWIYALCHRSSFNPWCDVSGIFFLKTSYVSLIYKCRIVFKIFTEPFLSNTLPWRGEISNISNRQTKSAWKYIITLLILLSQPYAPQETNIYKAGMLLCTKRVCIL